MKQISIRIRMAVRNSLAGRLKPAAIAAAAVLFGSLPSIVAWAALTDISNTPLGSASSATVKPNLLLTMDTSGSMAWDYMPDNVNPYNSNDNYPNNHQNNSYTCLNDDNGNNTCFAGDPPYYAPQFNFVAYNPTITYSPGVNYDGSSRGSMASPWTTVPVDQYTSSSGTINLTNAFPEQAYVNSAGVVKRNGEAYPTGNLPPTQSSVTVTAFSYATPAKPNITGVSISGFGSGTTVTGTTSGANTVAVGDIIDVVCTSGSGATTPFALADAVPVLSVSSNSFTFTAGQNWGTSNLSCSQATVKYSVVGYPEQTDSNGNALKGDATNWAIVVPLATNAMVKGTGTSTVVTVNFYNHGLVVNDVITVTGPSSRCTASQTKVTAVTLGTGSNAAVPVSFTYSVSSSGACSSGAYTILRQGYNSQVSGTTNAFAYRMTPTEYCADQHLSYCVASTVAVAGYPFPANGVRYCNSAGAAAAAPAVFTAPPSPLPSNPSCQNKYLFGAGYVYPRYGQFTRYDIVPANNAYTNWPTRTDCGSGTTCTYAQEMTNFANYYAYYHTRIQMMKTLLGLSFLNISNSYRVGYITINPGSSTSNPVSSSNPVSTTHYVPVSDFVTTQRQTFYTTLYAQGTGNSTPLRSALARAGRYFAGKHDYINSGMNDDPMQYSCQQNFTLLTTDGYWNTNLSNGDLEAVGLDGQTAIGDQDANASTQTQGIYEGGKGLDYSTNPATVLSTCAAGSYSKGGCANTLADVAAYYYNTDLRSSSLGNQNGALGTDVATDNVPATPTDPATTQHMTTFTLGLADGLMTWQSDYETATSGDFASLISSPPANGCWWPPVSGSSSTPCQWPVPLHDSPAALDDLWHAAVNGHGTYYHGTNPRSVASGIASALSGINVRLAAAAASSTSSPNITPTNNTIYSSTYDTVQWSGDLFAQAINTADGTVIPAKIWDAATTLDTMTSAASDTRTIYTLDHATNALKPFAWGNLTTTEQGTFTNVCTPSTNLTQCITLSATQLTQINDGYDLLNFVRGQRGNEGILFRTRTHVLGDTVDARPQFVAAPTFAFADAVSPTYSTFAAANASRAPMLYIGSNDGMLHAFDASVASGHNGAELWAYVPRALWSNLYRLSDTNYANLHQFYVDGSPSTMDAYFNGAWHTVLVGGYNSGGRGYYALDITNPSLPVALWEFCTDNTVCTKSDQTTSPTNSDLGLSYGNPIITKRAYDGKWVVLVTSGYNNVSPGTGQGFLYVLDLATGAVLNKIGTGVGTTTTPSGLAKIAAWADNFNLDNTTKWVYGGDLLGNVWRFDLTTATPTVLHLATLKDASGNVQPITTKPELGVISTYRVLFVGTGEYMGTSDLSSTSTQSLYAFKDLGTDYGTNLRGTNTLVNQAITSIDANTRTTSNTAVDWSQKNGWYVDFPTGGERVNIDPLLVLGTLLVDTNIPASNACTVGGTSWHYEFNYNTGAYVPTAQYQVVATRNSSAITVGFVVVQLPGGGGLKAIDTDATATKTTQGLNVGNSPLNGKRVGWRQL